MKSWVREHKKKKSCLLNERMRLEGRKNLTEYTLITELYSCENLHTASCGPSIESSFWPCLSQISATCAKCNVELICRSTISSTTEDSQKSWPVAGLKVCINHTSQERGKWNASVLNCGVYVHRVTSSGSLFGCRSLKPFCIANLGI